jgi:hypothetical protein
MTLDITADLGACKHSVDDMKKELPKALERMNGIFELVEYKKLN